MADYKIAYIDTTYNKLKTLNYNTGTGLFTIVGSELTLSSATHIISFFKRNIIAYYSYASATLDAYRWSSSAWAKISSPPRPQYAPNSSVSLSYCYPKRILVAGWRDENNYSSVSNRYFDGEYYTPIGYSYVGDGYSTLRGIAVAGIDINSYAYLSDGDNNLKTFNIVDNVPVQVGSTLTYSNSFPSMTGLYTNTVAIYNQANGQLKTMQFNGSTWSQLGSTLTITSGAFASITAIDTDKIAYYDDVNAAVRVYKFTAGVWSQIGTSYTTLVGGRASLSSFNSFIKFNYYNEVGLEGDEIWPTSDY